MPFFMPQLAFSPARTRCFVVPQQQQQQQCYQQQQRSRPEQSFLPFLSLIDEAVNEINKAAARQQREIREAQRVLQTRFDVRETAEGYIIDGELPGVEQQDLDIQFSDDQTLTIKGRSERRVEGEATTTTTTTDNNNDTEDLPQYTEEAKAIEEPTATTEEPASSASTIAAEPEHNDASSVKSYQATVEDDFEDLANDSDVGSTVSQQAAAKPDKGKQRATAEDEAIPDPPVSEIEQQRQQVAAPVETQPEQPKTRNWVSERSFGSFSRTFKFPVRVNTDAARASLRDGVLSIAVPKAPVPEVRRIWIQ